MVRNILCLIALLVVVSNYVNAEKGYRNATFYYNNGDSAVFLVEVKHRDILMGQVKIVDTQNFGKKKYIETFDVSHIRVDTIIYDNFVRDSICTYVQQGPRKVKRYYSTSLLLQRVTSGKLTMYKYYFECHQGMGPCGIHAKKVDNIIFYNYKVEVDGKFKELNKINWRNMLKKICKKKKLDISKIDLYNYKYDDILALVSMINTQI